MTELDRLDVITARITGKAVLRDVSEGDQLKFLVTYPRGASVIARSIGRYDHDCKMTKSHLHTETAD